MNGFTKILFFQYKFSLMITITLWCIVGLRKIKHSNVNYVISHCLKPQLLAVHVCNTSVAIIRSHWLAGAAVISLLTNDGRPHVRARVM
jgi:hypothetical protein